MLLLIGPGLDERHNTYICRGSDRQIKPLGPVVFDVVSESWRSSVTLLLLGLGLNTSQLIIRFAIG